MIFLSFSVSAYVKDLVLSRSSEDSKSNISVSIVSLPGGKKSRGRYKYKLFYLESIRIEFFLGGAKVPAAGSRLFVLDQNQRVRHFRFGVEGEPAQAGVHDDLCHGRLEGARSEEHRRLRQRTAAEVSASDAGSRRSANGASSAGVRSTTSRRAASTPASRTIRSLTVRAPCLRCRQVRPRRSRIRPTIRRAFSDTPARRPRRESTPSLLGKPG